MDDLDGADLFGVFEEVGESVQVEAKNSQPDAPQDEQEQDSKEDVNLLQAFGNYVPQEHKELSSACKTGPKACIVEVCFPPGWNVDETLAEMKAADDKNQRNEPAKEYKFELDPFQKAAVACIERDQSVLVSAHTSAGKTVVAEYAIALSLKRKQRVIYTSPIKALSNQKYRELQAEFEDVGLMTGDVTINPSASCLVMTTEILRSMLYRGNEVMREVAWCIFDEIHYMNNSERGVVWEETLVLLPHKVRHVFLSATIPNAREFASWIAKLHAQPCAVVYTEYRPTPLQHYVFPMAAEGVYLVVDEKSQFREESFRKAVSCLGQDDRDQGGRGGGANNKRRKGGRLHGGKKQEAADIKKLVTMIMDRGLEPAIVFAFSKRDCEKLALGLSKLDFTTAEDKETIEEVFNNAMDSLIEEDRQLPQVVNILPLLKRGIGIHHGGLLPILKEIIEILFQEGWCKVLFSTETFAMGLNMPARTVVFAGIQKFDGLNFRPLASGEYIQMSGRAGRRGLDDKGVVILRMPNDVDPKEVKQMMQGAANPLISAFHLGYNMLLNLIRAEGADCEYMMSRSFYQFQQNQKVPEMRARLKLRLQELGDCGSVELPALTSELTDLTVPLGSESSTVKVTVEDGAGSVGELYRLFSNLRALRSRLRRLITLPQYLLPFLNPGRLVKVHLPCNAMTYFERMYGSGKVVGAKRGRSDASASDSSDSTPSPEEPDWIDDIGDTNSSWDWGVLLSYSRWKKDAVDESKSRGGVSQQHYLMDVLLYGHAQNSAIKEAVQRRRIQANGDLPQPVPVERRGGYWVVIPVPSTCIQALSTIKVAVPKNLRELKDRVKLGSLVREAKRRYGPSSTRKDLPTLHPVKHMKITDEGVNGMVDKITDLEARVEKHAFRKHPHLSKLALAYRRQSTIQAQVQKLRLDIQQASQDVVMRNTLKKMTTVLRRLGCIEGQRGRYVVTVKGRVACELSTCDELLGTELMFTSVFSDLTPAQSAALLSCLVFEEKVKNPVVLDQEMKSLYDKLFACAERVGKVLVDARLPIELDDYTDRFKFDLMPVVMEWCAGSKFVDIIEMTDIFEGSIIRCFRRLEELLRQFAAASRAVGNKVLEENFLQAIALLKRDIVFAASLYL